MSITVEAIYENGVLKPSQPLPLKEHEKVQLVVERSTNWVDETYGLIRWTGDQETLRRFARGPELDLQEGA